MPNIIDIRGQRFGSLVVKEQAGRDKDTRRRVLWSCLCDCGKLIIVRGDNLKSGNSNNCGCLRTPTIIIKHGASANGELTPAYISWQHMIQRCTNVNHHAYSRYGGRGITVCKRWLGKHGFEHFLADMGERPKETTLDRYPDNDGGYKPTNCRWADWVEQENNRRTPNRVS